MKNLQLDSGNIVTLSHIADMIFVNAAFLAACIPIVTYGAAKAALYDCAVKWVRKEDAGLMTFFRSLKANLRSSLLPGLLIFLLTALLGLDVLISFSEEGRMHLRVITIVVMVLFFPYSEQIFLFLARFECRFLDLLRNTLIMCLTNPIRSMLSAAMMQLPLAVFLCGPELFLRLTMLWLLGYYSVAALLSAKMMKKSQEMIISEHTNQIEENHSMDNS